jgi:hypothetical protein
MGVPGSVAAGRPYKDRAMSVLVQTEIICFDSSQFSADNEHYVK